MIKKTSEIQSFKNLGQKSEFWLNKIGIYSRKDLINHGALQTYVELIRSGCPKNLNFLWALQTALMDIHFHELPLELKDQLKKDLENYQL